MDELMKPADIQLYAKPFLYKKLYYDDFCEAKRKSKSRVESTPYASKRKNIKNKYYENRQSKTGERVLIRT